MRTKLTTDREYYSSKENFKEFKTSVDNVVFYINETDLTAVAFSGKRGKKDWGYRFKSMTELEEFVDFYAAKIFKRNEAKENRKIENKIAKQNAMNNIKIGDIFTTSWGYEQTNRDFFQVVGKPSRSKVSVRMIKSETTKETSWCSANVKPIKNSFCSDEKVCLVNRYGNISKADRYGHDAYPASENESYHVSWGY